MSRPKGYKHTAETKTKIRKPKLGHPAWNKGKTKNELPQLSNSGVKKGNIPWMKGRYHTEESKKLISKNLVGKPKPKSDMWSTKRRGKNHWNWQGGKTAQDNLDRARFRQTIQRLVFERDEYTCQLCEQVGGKLQVDHIQSWSEYIKLRFDINNCRTVCMNCHYRLTFGKDMPISIKTWGHNFKQLERMVN